MHSYATINFVYDLTRSILQFICNKVIASIQQKAWMLKLKNVFVIYKKISLFLNGKWSCLVFNHHTSGAIANEAVQVSQFEKQLIPVVPVDSNKVFPNNRNVSHVKVV